MPYGLTPVRGDSTHKAAFQVLLLRANGYLFRESVPRYQFMRAEATVQDGEPTVHHDC